jgi:hypothetical protein
VTSSRIVALMVVIGLGIHTGPAGSQQVETQAGVVEFVGLHRWTVGMIRDSMIVHAPRQPLGECAAVLRSLGFPSAESLHTVSADGRRTILVIVVEPQDSQLVRRLPIPGGHGMRPKMWEEGFRIMRDANGAFQAGTQTFGIHATGDSVREGLIMSLHPRDSAGVRAMWRFLENNRNRTAARLAGRILLGNSNFEDRALAAAILGAQRGRAEAWYALAKGMRDADERVAGVSEQGLRSLATGAYSKINWRPARSDLRAIIGGTNVLALRTTLAVITQTKIEPALARELLRDNGFLVFDLLGSHSKEHQEAAHNFLVLAAGKDFGMSGDTWRKWLASGGRR